LNSWLSSLANSVSGILLTAQCQLLHFSVPFENTALPPSPLALGILVLFSTESANSSYLNLELLLLLLKQSLG